MAYKILLLILVILAIIILKMAGDEEIIRLQEEADELLEAFDKRLEDLDTK